MPLLRLLPLLLMLTGCAIGEKPLGALSRPDAVKGILLEVATGNLDPTLSNKEWLRITEDIARNLNSWGYPVYAPPSADDKDLTHRMEARVGKAERKSTPPGLSFNLGNSDPRALEFQRADVIPITCLLSSLDKPGDAIKLSGDFSVETGFNEWVGMGSSKTPAAFYVDRIGTVCLNLLAELKLSKPNQAVQGSSARAWIPEIRIEVKDKENAASHPSTIPVMISEPGKGSVDAKPSESVIQTETRQDEGDRRKQIIIHNRGVPVILEFGYERK